MTGKKTASAKGAEGEPTDKARAWLEDRLSRFFDPGTRGSVEVRLGNLVERTGGRSRGISCDRATVWCRDGRILKIPVVSGQLQIGELSVDGPACATDGFRIVGKPVVAPTLVVEQTLIEEPLAKLNVLDLQVMFDRDHLVLTGRYPVFLLKVPFRVRGRLCLWDGNVACILEELAFGGVPADRDRVDRIQSKLAELIPIRKALNAIGLGGATVRGGTLMIRSGKRTVFAVTL